MSCRPLSAETRARLNEIMDSFPDPEPKPHDTVCPNCKKWHTGKSEKLNINTCFDCRHRWPLSNTHTQEER